MTVTLTSVQLEWIKAHVARGEFPSVEDAVRQLVDERIAAHELDEDGDLSWAKPFVDEGLAALGRGEFITVEEHKARNAARLKAIAR